MAPARPIQPMKSSTLYAVLVFVLSSADGEVAVDVDFPYAAWKNHHCEAARLPSQVC